MGIVVLGAVFVDIKGYPSDVYIPGGRNAGRVEQMHGGVSRNIVEDIANVELQPTFIGLVDDTGAGADVVRKLKAHKVNTDYIRVTKDGMGTWLAIFDNGGDVVAAISKRPDLRPILSILEEQGDEIISRADSIAFEIDMDKEIVKKVFALAEKYHKPVYAVVSNMSIAVERRDFFRSTHCFVCNQQEAGILFSEDYDDKTPEEMQRLLAARIRSAQIPRMVVTMGAQGAVYATNDGEEGWCPAKKVDVKVFALAEKYHKPVYAVVSNMSIAVERRDFFRSTHCFVCNQQEAGILFSEDYDDKTPEEMQRLLAARIRSAQIPRMVVTMGAQGAVYATNDGEEGWCPAKKVDVKDTTGAGDAFFAGVTIGLTYGKTMAEACEIGTRLAASVICTSENVCPRFLPSEFGIDPSGLEREQLSLPL